MNFENSVKSKGVVVFAFNTNTTDYVAIADQTARLIKHNLNLPVTLITEASSRPKFNYDQIIHADNIDENFINGDSQKQWRNFGRYLAYKLSPYTETILLDTDYLVLDDSLLKLFATEFDYKLMHHSYTPSNALYEKMGETSLPFVWATIVLFRKTKRARLFFNLVGRIQRNYQYYRALYNMRERNYRNDYAFAIANCIISGYSLNENQGIPWPMLTVDQKINRVMLTDNFVQIYHEDAATVVPYQNIHVMDKEYLQSRDFEQVVEAICEPT
jgi:hypothetical protein